jgi:Flp pilus assembly protein TadG
LLEFALVFPLILLFILGVVDVGRMFYTSVVVANAAREATRFAISYGILYDTEINQLLLADNGSFIRQAAIDEAASAGITLVAGDVVVQCLPSGLCIGGQPVRVTVTADYNPITLAILGNLTIPITRAAEMMIPSGGS